MAQLPFPLTRDRSVVALVLLTGLIYAHCLGGGYFLDDESIYLEDPLIRQGTLQSAFSGDLPRFIPRQEGYHYYRPGAILTHIVLARLFANDPFLLHLVSVIGHAAASILVFLLLRQFLAGHQAWMAGLFFVAHPLHVEAVAWMAAAPEIVAACFMLLSLCTLLWARAGPRWLLGLSYASAAAALLTKETALALPLMIVVLLAWRREPVLRAWPYFLIAAATLVLRLLTFGFGGAPPPAPTLAENLGILAAAAVHHTRKLLWPWPLAVEYEVHQPPAVWLMAAIVWMAAAWLARRSQQVRYALLLIAVPLLPALASSVILPVLRQVQDRHAYTAVMGLAFLVALATDRRAGQAGAAALLVLWSALSIAALRHWRDPESVWRNTLGVTPRSKSAVLGLGDWYYSTGRLEEAERVYNHGLAFRPQDREILVSRAAIRKILRRSGTGKTATAER